jgi:4-alpha-glucanotransferase
MVTNHDVSTLAGWWNGADLKLRCDCGLLDADQDLPGLLEQRQHDKLCLLAWLQSLQLLPTGWIGSIDELDKPFDIALCRAILAGNARSQSRIVLFQLDDLQLLEEPVNIPGTYREYPNWRRKQRLDTSTLFQDPQIQSLMASTKRERQG